jgi:CO/xanthine dehydrogenase FAD-binding subunit
VDEVLSLLQRYGDEAKILAGGQSLIPLLNFRLSAPSALIDMNRVSELAYIRHQPGQLRIGAMTRQRQIEFSDLVHQHVPLLHRATQLIGHLPIRTRGTIGGSMVHADPAAEYPAVAVALDAEFVVQGPRGSRVLAAEDFFVSYLTTALMPDELLLEVRFPTACSSHGRAFVEFARRHGDLPWSVLLHWLRCGTSGVTQPG